MYIPLERSDLAVRPADAKIPHNEKGCNGSREGQEPSHNPNCGRLSDPRENTDSDSSGKDRPGSREWQENLMELPNPPHPSKVIVDPPTKSSLQNHPLPPTPRFA